MSLLWCIACAIFIIAQKIYGGLILLGFAIGSLFTFFISLVIPNSLILLTTFIGSSLLLSLLLIYKRPSNFSHPLTLSHHMDELTGQHAIVTKTIGSTPLESGLIKLDHEIWHAFSSTGESIPAGSVVVVDSLQGIRAKVTPLSNPTY